MSAIPARDVARMLGERAEQLAQELLPGAWRREGNELVAASIEGGSRRGLSVRIRGAKAGIWADFSGSARGDGLDLVAHLRRCDKPSAYRWALGWLGLGDGGPAPPRAPPPRPAQAGPDAAELATRAAALRLFLGAEPHLAGTPAGAYLKARGIDLGELGRQPRSLRYHPACRCTETATDLPAMLAAICGPDGQPIATHRTWLAKDADGVWRKAPLRAPKKVLGSYAGGSIRLWRGSSGKPLRDAPPSQIVVIAEGIENGLSVAVACPENRVLAAVSVGNFARITLPAAALNLVIAADNDAGNPAAEATLQRAIHRWLSEGRSVRVARSSIAKDFNAAMTGQE